MVLTLQSIYNYIFCNEWADPRYNLSEKLTPEARQKQIESRKKKMKELFTKAILPAKLTTFRAALRLVGASHLETALFGNSSDEIKETYPFPSLAEILRIFAGYEQQAHYFEKTENKESKEFTVEEEAFDKFRLFFIVCKIIGDFIEGNNTPDNTPAFLHAYKMAVIFGDQEQPEKYFESFDNYLMQHNYLKTDHPVHDALIWECPLNSPTLYLPQWRTIIHKTGVKGFQLFQRATAIGAQLKRPPESYQEALKTARSITYKRSDENPELAELFIHYNLNEAEFDKALGILAREKKSDNLPTIVIKGEDIGVPRYYLIKLPIGDYRALILGHITNCCQSIGGYSEMCVIDGITLCNNGFLVLLKERFRRTDKMKPQDEKTPRTILTEKDLDIKELLTRCKIMGQGYIWRTEEGNLTIDSWENLNPKAEDAIAVKLLKQYADDCIQQNNQIIRVTIGEGGKTPSEFISVIKFPEKMLEGVQYEDSKIQLLISYNHRYQQDLQKQIKILFPDISDIDFDRLTNIDANYSGATLSALQMKSVQDELKNPALLTEFASNIHWKGCRISNIFTILEEAKLCTPETVAALFALDNSVLLCLDYFLLSLKKSDLLNKDNLELIYSLEFKPKKDQNSRDYFSYLNQMDKLSEWIEVLAKSNALNAATLNFIIANKTNANDFHTLSVILKASHIPINLQTVSFIQYYLTDSLAAIKTLSDILGQKAPNIYQYLQDKLRQHELKDEVKSAVPVDSSVNYSEVLSKSSAFKNCNLILDATYTLLVLCGDSKTISYQHLIPDLTLSGNATLLDALLKNKPDNINLEALFSSPENRKYLLEKIWKSDIASIDRYVIPKYFAPIVEKALTNYTMLLLYALDNGNKKVAEIYINSGADINLALLIAVKFRFETVVKILLTEKNADPNYMHSDVSFTLLESALESYHSNIVRLIIEARADLNKSKNLLTTAEKKYNKDNITLLIKSKVDINFQQGDEKNTPLHHAMYGEDVEVLLKYGANIEAVNAKGQTPLEYAVATKTFHSEAIQKLLELGAKSDLNKYKDISLSALYNSCLNSENKKILKDFHLHLLKNNLIVESAVLSGSTHSVFNSSGITQEVKDNEEVKKINDRDSTPQKR